MNWTSTIEFKYNGGMIDVEYEASKELYGELEYFIISVNDLDIEYLTEDFLIGVEEALANALAEEAASIEEEYADFEYSKMKEEG